MLTATFDAYWTDFIDALYVEDRVERARRARGGGVVLMRIARCRPRRSRSPRRAQTRSTATPWTAQGGDANGDFDGISPGPTHRAGQQCLVCHGGDGPGPDFAFAGTIYATRNDSEPRRGRRDRSPSPTTRARSTISSRTRSVTSTSRRMTGRRSWPANVQLSLDGPDHEQVPGLNIMNCPISAATEAAGSVTTVSTISSSTCRPSIVNDASP